MNRLLRAAIIGCGSIGSSMQDKLGAENRGICTHAAAYKQNDNVELVAFCDASKDILQQSIQRWGEHSCYDNYQQLLYEQNPQLVSIATHVDSHFEITKACLSNESVQAVLLEKPVSNDLEEAKELLEIANQKNKLLSINYTRRFLPIFRKLSADIAIKKWGEPISVNGIYTKGIIHNGTHWIDLYRMMFGEPVSATATAKFACSTKVDPEISFTLQQDAFMHVDVQSFPVSAYTIFDMDILFAKGRIRVIDQSDTVEIYEVKKNHPFDGYEALELTERYEHCLKDSMTYAIDDLVAAVLSGSKLLSPVRNAIRNIELATDVINSHS